MSKINKSILSKKSKECNNKDLCELKSNTSNSTSLEVRGNINDTVVMFDSSITFKASESKKVSTSQTINVSDIFSFSGVKGYLGDEDGMFQTGEVIL